MATQSAQWREGMEARKAGQLSHSNPYEAGSQQSADWLDGFTYDEPEQNVDRPEPSEG
ncbi:hypothetical protein SAMN05216360_105156 [Methylobacterium phyllostachyos]|uniref:Ribosome modulation factor n=1 Tax=Methylobacterium phyllostachyos TaxID=582672 RepID=A0A1G9Y3G1_9HYPH|nr:hypothetical protein [Methylobacterium phyllostachyos]SDN03644.1 hypothetical protein SAMN05216360_105156 [Methylobacterium phyllostachyos]